jgi:CO/xanthine dehydrogenase FAD-binding subunit
MTEVVLPQNLEELWGILHRHPEAAVYAGGTDLLVRLRSGVVRRSHLVCLERIEALKGVYHADEEILIGSGATHTQVMEHPVVQQDLPVLAKAIKVLGSPPIRHVGTIGGNIVTASPAGDTLPALHVLDAEVEIQSSSHSRRVKVGDFILGPGEVDLKQGEILSRIVVKRAPEWNIHHYEKVGRRKAQACAVASMAAVLQVSETGKIDRVRLAWGSVAPTVVESREIEEALVGRPIALETFKGVCHMVQDVISPIDDVRATAEYRRAVAAALVRRLAEYERQLDPVRNRIPNH